MAQPSTEPDLATENARLCATVERLTRENEDLNAQVLALAGDLDDEGEIAPRVETISIAGNVL